MNRLEKILSGWNFKKIAVWYIVLAVIFAVACTAAVGYVYRERLNFAFQYSRLEEAKDEKALQTAADKTAKTSADVIDVLITDSENRLIYSAEKSEFAEKKIEFTKSGDDKKYLVCTENPNAVFKYVKADEFMLNSIINKDFGKIRSDYEDDSVFESNLSSKTVYMLNMVKAGGSKVYVITLPTSVPNGMAALKITAALAMLFFGVYWVLIALWLYNDAAKHRLSPLYWGVIGLFTNLVGLVVYKIYKRSLSVCPVCNAAQSSDHLFCPFCGNKLGSRCENCGSKIGEKDAFCHHCGVKIK